MNKRKEWEKKKGSHPRRWIRRRDNTLYTTKHFEFVIVVSMAIRHPRVFILGANLSALVLLTGSTSSKEIGRSIGALQFGKDKPWLRKKSATV
jgi:hypothetical protein